MKFPWNVLDRKLVRDLAASRSLSASIAVLTALGIACYVAMQSCSRNLEAARAEFYAEQRMADFWIDVKRLPRAELSRLAELPGVSQISGRLQFPVVVDLDTPNDANNANRPLAGAVISLPRRGLTTDGFPAPILNDIRIQSGGGFSENADNEVIVSAAFAKARNLRPGDSIHLIMNQTRHRLTIVGAAVSPEFVYLIAPGGLFPEPENYGVFYLDAHFAEQIFGFEGACNQVVGQFTPTSSETARLTTSLLFQERLEPYGAAIVIPLRDQVSHWFVSSELNQLRHSALFLPAIFLSVAVVILNVLMKRKAEQQRVVMGMFKAIGYTNSEIMSHYLKFGLVIGLFGGVVGGLAGYGLAEAMTAEYRNYYTFPHLVNRAHWPSIAFGVVLSLLVSVLGAARGVRIVARLQPAAAMRPKPPERGGRSRVENAAQSWFSLRGWTGRLIIRTITRNPFRTLAGIFAAAMGASLLFTGFFATTAMEQLIHFQFETFLNADYELVYRDLKDDRELMEAKKFPGIARVEPVLTVACTLRHDRRERKIAVMGMDADAFMNVPRDEQGVRVPVPPSGLLITEELARVLNLKVGDTVLITPYQGRRLTVGASVVRIIASYIGLGAYADRSYLNQLINERNTHSGILLQADPALSNRTRDDLYRVFKALPALQTVIAYRDQKQSMDATLSRSMSVMNGVILFFAAAIFCGSILNNGLTSVSERQREIAMYRVLGYAPREIGRLFLGESLIINTIGTLVGLPLGYALCYALVEANRTELFRLPLIVTPAMVVKTLGCALAFTLLAHAGVHRGIVRLPWQESLKTGD